MYLYLAKQMFKTHCSTPRNLILYIKISKNISGEPCKHNQQTQDKSHSNEREEHSYTNFILRIYCLAMGFILSVFLGAFKTQNFKTQNF